MTNWQLQPLDPTVDTGLYHEAYYWRAHKTHLQVDRMPLEMFTADDPTHLTVGLFAPDLVAVYFLREWEPRRYEAHFTSKRGTSRQLLLEAGANLLRIILSYADEVSALIVPANRALRQFVTELGFERVGMMQFFCCTDVSKEPTISVRNQRRFIKYVKHRNPLGIERPYTEIQSDIHKQRQVSADCT